MAGLAIGEVSEWPKVHPWKGCVRESVPRVRIPPSPFSGRGGNPPSPLSRKGLLQAPELQGLALFSRFLTGRLPSMLLSKYSGKIRAQCCGRF